LKPMTDLNDLCREVYARFGLSYYLAECLHSQLCVTYATIGFRSPEDATQPRIEEKLKWASRQMMGPLIEAVRSHVPPTCAESLVEALTWRNKLAHGFWFDRAHLMFNEQGLQQVLEELRQASAVFEATDEQLTTFYHETRNRLGISDEAVALAQERLLAGQTEPPLPTKRFPRKEERLLRAWRYTVGERRATVFEAEDGLLLQLCESGLGWSSHEKPGLDWSTDEKLQAYLPATVRTKPAAPEPWKYELQLKGAVLEVSKPADSDTVQFRVRRRK
jgi:hypothetical protein